MELAKEKLAKYIDTAVASLSNFDERAMPLIVIARYVMERKS
jgi:geranylgeranyl diphosphate synthase type II